MAVCSFNSKYGKVVYHVVKLPGCCGVAVIHNPIFLVVKNKDKLYKGFKRHLLNSRPCFDIQRKILMMTDRVGGSVYRFCKATGWPMSEPVINPKTGNKIVTFMHTRANDKVNPL